MKPILVWFFLCVVLCGLLSGVVAVKKLPKSKIAETLRAHLVENSTEAEDEAEYATEEEYEDDEEEGPPSVTCGPSNTVMFANMDCWKQCKLLGGTPSNCQFTKTTTTCVCVGLPVLGAGKLTPKGLYDFFSGHIRGTYHSTVNFFTTKHPVGDEDDDEVYDEEEENENEALENIAKNKTARF